MRTLTAVLITLLVSSTLSADESKTPMIDKYSENLDSFYADCTQVATENYKEMKQHLMTKQLLVSEEVAFIYVHTACMQSTMQSHTTLFVEFMNENFKAI